MHRREEHAWRSTAIAARHTTFSTRREARAVAAGREAPEVDVRGGEDRPCCPPFDGFQGFVRVRAETRSRDAPSFFEGRLRSRFARYPFEVPPSPPGRRGSKTVQATRRPEPSGDASGATPLASLVERNYRALREIAAREIRSRRASRSISPTSLVGETMVRLMRQRNLPRTDPHLCGLATILMVQALADRGRRSGRAKRTPGRSVLPIGQWVTEDRRRPDAGAARRREFRVRVLKAMKVLASAHPREMEVVSLRLVLEMPVARVAAMIGVSSRTVYRLLDEGLLRLKAHLDSGEA